MKWEHTGETCSRLSSQPRVLESLGSALSIDPRQPATGNSPCCWTHSTVVTARPPHSTYSLSKHTSQSDCHNINMTVKHNKAYSTFITALNIFNTNVPSSGENIILYKLLQVQSIWNIVPLGLKLQLKLALTPALWQFPAFCHWSSPNAALFNSLNWVHARTSEVDSRLPNFCVLLVETHRGVTQPILISLLTLRSTAALLLQRDENTNYPSTWTT